MFARSAGADYVELPAGALLTDPSYCQTLAELKPETTNLFFPPLTALYEDEEQSTKIGSGILMGAAEAGVAICVVGSGGARKSPKGKSPEWAEAKFIGIITTLSQFAKGLGIRVAPESLNRSECDVFCKLSPLAAQLQNYGVGYTADSYHVLKEWDFDARPRSLEEEFQKEVPHAPLHAHLGGLDRSPPCDQDPMILAFFKRLKMLDYDGRVSIEVNWDDFESQLPQALDATRRMWEVA